MDPDAAEGVIWQCGKRPFGQPHNYIRVEEQKINDRTFHGYCQLVISQKSLRDCDSKSPGLQISNQDLGMIQPWKQIVLRQHRRRTPPH
jgi:hypothetical protein